MNYNGKNYLQWMRPDLHRIQLPFLSVVTDETSGPDLSNSAGWN